MKAGTNSISPLSLKSQQSHGLGETAAAPANIFGVPPHLPPLFFWPPVIFKCSFTWGYRLPTQGQARLFPHLPSLSSKLGYMNGKACRTGTQTALIILSLGQREEIPLCHLPQARDSDNFPCKHCTDTNMMYLKHF